MPSRSTCVNSQSVGGVRVARSYVVLFSFGHCVVCPSSIYRFWYPLWYLQTLLTFSGCSGKIIGATTSWKYENVISYCDTLTLLWINVRENLINGQSRMNNPETPATLNIKQKTKASIQNREKYRTPYSKKTTTKSKAKTGKLTITIQWIPSELDITLSFQYLDEIYGYFLFVFSLWCRHFDGSIYKINLPIFNNLSGILSSVQSNVHIPMLCLTPQNNTAG